MSFTMISKCREYAKWTCYQYSVLRFFGASPSPSRMLGGGFLWRTINEAKTFSALGDGRIYFRFKFSLPMPWLWYIQCGRLFVIKVIFAHAADSI